MVRRRSLNHCDREVDIENHHWEGVAKFPKEVRSYKEDPGNLDHQYIQRINIDTKFFADDTPTHEEESLLHSIHTRNIDGLTLRQGMQDIVH